MKAALPHLTSRTSVASCGFFFEIIEAVISGILSIVSVTSRMAYSSPSAGAIASFWAAIQQPINCPAFVADCEQLKPGIDSNLSIVPPVWPKPLPATLALSIHG